MKKPIIILAAAMAAAAAPPESICSGNASREIPREMKCKNLYLVWDEKIDQARLVYAEQGKPIEPCIIKEETYWAYKVCDDNGLVRNKRAITQRAKKEGKIKKIKITE